MVWTGLPIINGFLIMNKIGNYVISERYKKMAIKKEILEWEIKSATVDLHELKRKMTKLGFIK